MKKFLIISGLLFIICISLSLKLSAQKPTLNHIAVYVFDLKKSSSFYHDIIGLDTIPEPFHDGKHIWFKIGEHSQLHLIQGAQVITKHDKDSHTCFSVADISAFINLLKSKNISFESWKGDLNVATLRADGVKQIYFKDPDGYWIEVNDDKF